jgi:hypothetical protein
MSPSTSPSFTPAADSGQALPVRGKSNGNAAPANGPAEATSDDTVPRLPAQASPAAGGPSNPGSGTTSRLPAFGGQAPPQAPRIPSIGSQDVRGGDGPSAGDRGPNGAQATDGATDSGPVTVPPSATQDQRLPIFDSLESDWFRRSGKSLSTARPTAGGQAGASGGQSWTSPADEGWRASPADEGWRAAQAVAVPSAGNTTQAGLPKRVPRANLVPGSVGGGGGDAEADAPTRSPDAARTRMASYQRGVREGRAATPQTEEP